MDTRSKALPWQHRVANEIADHVDTVVVLTHRVGAVEPRGNVRIHTFPRWPQRAPFRWVGGRYWLNVMVWRLCRKARLDVCFVHMNFEWAYRLYPAFRLLRMPIVIWYAHGSVTNRLRVAHRVADRILTSTPEGFRIPSSKVRVIGQGVDTDLFALREPRERSDLIYVGRISERKRVDRLIAMVDHLHRELGFRCTLHLVGGPLTDRDAAYEDTLRASVARLALEGSVVFHGAVPQAAIAELYAEVFLHVNFSDTGSLDKTILESLAIGCPVLTSNVAAADVLGGYPELVIDDPAPADAAERVLVIYRKQLAFDPRELRSLVAGVHDTASYARRIVDELAAQVQR